MQTAPCNAHTAADAGDTGRLHTRGRSNLVRWIFRWACESLLCFASRTTREDKHAFVLLLP